MTELRESLPCIICGKVLYRDHEDYELQPRDGIMCSTTGNYGSRVVDYMNGEQIHFNICDGCITKAGREGSVAVSQGAIPVTTDCYDGRGGFIASRVGWKQVERPIVPWHAELKPLDEREHIEGDEFARDFFQKYWENERYQWSLGEENYKHLIKDWLEHVDDGRE